MSVNSCLVLVLFLFAAAFECCLGDHLDSDGQPPVPGDASTTCPKRLLAIDQCLRMGTIDGRKVADMGWGLCASACDVQELPTCSARCDYAKLIAYCFNVKGCDDTHRCLFLKHFAINETANCECDADCDGASTLSIFPAVILVVLQAIVWLADGWS
eukprot:gnl/TRDRNA2_/TRDRNA2_90905_c0_seq1.p1 gnl/TRDRNA2_/TRDRNA2_90905_c0~~gnl/TRDRNA2_/TRDRNA2_90905_c0_seq1.p1  ORF type:complete len:157 (-),score=23.49 gnl/TRDRNA2_/TRDRNA2_90905_c0_seq1:93-563(-)